MPVGEPAGRRELPLIARPGRPRTEPPLRSTRWPVGAAPVLESRRTPTQRPDLWIAKRPPLLPTAAWIRATLAARPSWFASSTRSPSSRDSPHTNIATTTTTTTEETPTTSATKPLPHYTQPPLDTSHPMDSIPPGILSRKRGILVAARARLISSAPEFCAEAISPLHTVFVCLFVFRPPSYSFGRPPSIRLILLLEFMSSAWN